MMRVSRWYSTSQAGTGLQPTALFAQVFQADMATLEASKDDLEFGTDTLKPSAVLIEVYFWATAKE